MRSLGNIGALRLARHFRTKLGTDLDALCKVRVVAAVAHDDPFQEQAQIAKPALAGIAADQGAGEGREGVMDVVSVFVASGGPAAPAGRSGTAAHLLRQQRFNDQPQLVGYKASGQGPQIWCYPTSLPGFERRSKNVARNLLKRPAW